MKYLKYMKAAHSLKSTSKMQIVTMRLHLPVRWTNYKKHNIQCGKDI